MVLEEQVQGGGVADSSPMSLFKLLTTIEKRGAVDFKLTGHKIERPAAVRRGEAADAIDVSHETYSVYKMNNVVQKHVKAGSLASFIGQKALSGSQHITLVWRALVVFFLFVTLMNPSPCPVLDPSHPKHIRYAPLHQRKSDWACKANLLPEEVLPNGKGHGVPGCVTSQLLRSSLPKAVSCKSAHWRG